MSGCDEWSLLKVFELLLCISCLIYKWWTDYEASRLFFFLEKQSREWPLLNNVTWNQSGSWFADVTFGAYTIICIALFIAHLIGELKSTQKTECFLLGIGSLLFIGVGLMVMSSFDSVPDELFDNALILGTLALVTGFVFLVDISCLRNRKHDFTSNDKTARDLVMINENVNVGKTEKSKNKKTAATVSSSPPADKKSSAVAANEPVESKKGKIVEELRSSFRKKSPAKESRIEEPKPVQLAENEVQTSAVTGRRNMENRGFPIDQSPDTKRKISFQLENYNNYDYEVHSVRSYDRMLENEFEDNRSKSRYQPANKTTTDSQVQTEYGTVDRSRSRRDVQTATPIHADQVDYALLQSPKITSSSGLPGSGSPSSDEAYGSPHSAAAASYLVSDKVARKAVPTLTPCRIQKLSNCSNGNPPFYRHCDCCTNGKPDLQEPTSPQDKGYVLHTASKWPNATPLSPESYRKQTEAIVKYYPKTLHSDV